MGEMMRVRLLGLLLAVSVVSLLVSLGYVLAGTQESLSDLRAAVLMHEDRLVVLEEALVHVLQRSPYVSWEEL